MRDEFSRGPRAKVADVVVQRADGTEQAVELVYGKNLLALTDLAAVAGAPPLWSGKTLAGEDVAWRVLLIDVPGPSPVRGLVFRSADAAPSLLIAAITALGDVVK